MCIFIKPGIDLKTLVMRSHAKPSKCGNILKTITTTYSDKPNNTRVNNPGHSKNVTVDDASSVDNPQGRISNRD